MAVLEEHEVGRAYWAIGEYICDQCGLHIDGGYRKDGGFDVDCGMDLCHSCADVYHSKCEKENL